MNIFANTVVTLTFELFDSDGALLEATPSPITYLHGGHSGMLPKLEEALNLKQAGDAVSVAMEPEDAFGDYDPELVKIESAERLPADVAVGMQLETYANLGDEPGQRDRLHGHRHRRRQGRARRQPSVGGQAAALRLPDPRRPRGDAGGGRARARARRRRPPPPLASGSDPGLTPVWHFQDPSSLRSS